MENIFARFLEELGAWVIKKAPKQVRYILATFVFVFIQSIFCLVLLETNIFVAKVCIFILMIIFLGIYIYLLRKIYVSKTKNKNNNAISKNR